MKSGLPLSYPPEVPIWVDRERLSGAPCFKGTRVSRHISIRRGLHGEHRGRITCDKFTATVGVRALDLLHVASARILARTERNRRSPSPPPSPQEREHPSLARSKTHDWRCGTVVSKSSSASQPPPLLRERAGVRAGLSTIF